MIRGNNPSDKIPSDVIGIRELIRNYVLFSTAPTLVVIPELANCILRLNVHMGNAVTNVSLKQEVTYVEKLLMNVILKRGAMVKVTR